jgi:hypothetical protein
MRLGVLGILLQVWSMAPALAGAVPETSVAEERASLIKQAAEGARAIPALAAALQDENLVIRRTTLRLLVGMGAPARPILEEALGNTDVLVRRAALEALCRPPTPASLPLLEQALADTAALLRLTAVSLVVQLQPRTDEVVRLLERARKDEAVSVREIAAQALWPFFRETVSLRERRDWDHEIRVSQTILLPLDGWRLLLDPGADGHLQRWYEPDCDDSAWLPIRIGSAWEEQGQVYDGVAWYRGWFDLPAKPECLGVEMAFGGVDEIAWVWVNGQYIGQHDLGTEGWDKPFALDVTAALQWGARNQVTVRVYDSAYAGGIWKPVTLEVLR